MTLIVTKTDDIEACRALRRAVFIDEQGIAEADEWDDLDDHAQHLLAQRDGVPLGTARCLFNAPVGKIGRICVLAPHRGTGVGVALVEAAIGLMRDRPRIETIKLGSQLHAMEFYRRFGFEAEGPIYDDAGIPHRDMVLAVHEG